jgi:hypothetical protein
MVPFGCIQGNPENAGGEVQNVTDWGDGFLAWECKSYLFTGLAIAAAKALFAVR